MKRGSVCLAAKRGKCGSNRKGGGERERERGGQKKAASKKTLCHSSGFVKFNWSRLTLAAKRRASNACSIRLLLYVYA